MIARVSLEIALRKEFDYLIPSGLAGQVDVGSRVQVPFGPRKVLGCVTALAAFRKLEHAQYSFPCRLNAGPSGLFDVHIHIRSRKNTTSQHDRLCCPIHPFGSF